jgi:hypothetical protein
MKKLIPFLISGVLVVGAVGCQNSAKTSSDAPNSTTESPKASDAQSTQSTKNDAQSETRKNQLNSDIRAHEQRNNAVNGGGAANRDAGDLKSEVRSKLEANIPGSKLAVQAKDGVVTIAGTVPNQQDKGKIQPLATQIKGVKSVVDKTSVLPAKTKG